MIRGNQFFGTGFSGNIGLPPSRYVLNGLYYSAYVKYRFSGRYIAPTGWHIPTHAETEVLRTYYATVTTTLYDANGFADLKRGRYMQNGPDTWGPGFEGQFGYFQIEDDRDFMWNDAPYGNNPNGNLDNGGVNWEWYGVNIRCLRDNNTGWTDSEIVMDIDKNLYTTVQLGTQIWLKQNLAVKRYRDGAHIHQVSGPWINNSTLGAVYTPYPYDGSNVYV